MSPKSVRNASLRHSFEPLERRVLMCSTVAQLVANGIPASIVHEDGHISRADYENLTPELRAHVDPHWIEEQSGPIDYDKLMGLPKFMSEAEANAYSGPEADSLPDFFPLMYQVNSNLDLTSQPGRALLKFGTQVNNQGGPNSLISGRPGIDAIPSGAPITSWTNPDGSQNVLQAVYNWTGSGYTLSYWRSAGRMTYHEGHSHFHYDGYAEYALRYRNGDGTVGAYVQRPDGSGVVGSKTGFCLLTFSGTFTTESGVNSSTLQGYNMDTSVPSGCGLQQGVRVGRYDQYSSGLEGQWIDVAGVTPGQYFVEIQLDGQNTVLETNEVNNAKNFQVTIPNYTPGNPITPDNYDAGGANNNTFATAADLEVMGTGSLTALTVHWGLDEDFFKFVASSSGPYTVTTSGNGNVELYLYDASQTLIDSSTNPNSTETVNWNFVKGQTYYAMARSYNSTVSNNYQMNFTLKPQVSYSAPVNRTREGDAVNRGQFVVSRNGPTANPLVMTLNLGGTATLGTDYTLEVIDGSLTGNQLTVGTHAAAATILVRALADNFNEPLETVTLSIASGAAYVSDGGTSVISIYNVNNSAITPGQTVSRPGAFFNSKALLGNDDERSILSDIGLPLV